MLSHDSVVLLTFPWQNSVSLILLCQTIQNLHKTQQFCNITKSNLAMSLTLLSQNLAVSLSARYQTFHTSNLSDAELVGCHMVHRQNVEVTNAKRTKRRTTKRRMGQNAECQNVEWDKMSNRQNVEWDKTPNGQNIECKKCRMGQNVEWDKMSNRNNI